jgi:hypothetical protein
MSLEMTRAQAARRWEDDMRKTDTILVLPFVLAMAGCGGSGSPPAANPLPPPSNNISVPSSVNAVSGYHVSTFAAPPSASTKPDSIVQIGNSVFVGFGDDVNPDGTPGPSGKTQVEIVRYDLSGKLQKTFEVSGHNDGLMEFDPNTLWAMSNEDGNAKLVVINLATGTQQSYTPQPSLLNGSGGLPHGGGLDDMQLIFGKVYVSASNPTVNASATCASDSSTPGCPNGVNTGPFVYTLSLNADGSTFNLTPVATSNTTAVDVATNASGTLNMTDPDSEVVSLDGSTLIVDGQQDSELALIKNPGAGQTVSFLPLSLSGSATSVDDTRFVPGSQTFLLLADTSQDLIYRIDGGFKAGEAYSAGPTTLLKLNIASGVLTPVVSGMQAPHGMAFITR